MWSLIGEIYTCAWIGLNLNLVFPFYDFHYVFPRHLKIVWCLMGFLRSITMILVSELTLLYFYSVRTHASNFLLVLTTCSVSKGGFALFVIHLNWQSTVTCTVYCMAMIISNNFILSLWWWWYCTLGLPLYVSHSELREVKIRLLFNCGLEIQKLLGLVNYHAWRQYYI